MSEEELVKMYVGLYYIDKYELDSEKSYIRVRRIYRVNGVKPMYSKKGNGGYKLFCTMMSICNEENKKTGEKTLVEGRISETEMKIRTGEKNDLFNDSHISDKETWDNIAKELVSTVCEQSKTLITFQNYCEVCENNGTENCRFCCKRGDEIPTLYNNKK